jgi:hypothetical protein
VTREEAQRRVNLDDSVMCHEIPGWGINHSKDGKRTVIKVLDLRRHP